MTSKRPVKVSVDKNALIKLLTSKRVEIVKKTAEMKKNHEAAEIGMFKLEKEVISNYTKTHRPSCATYNWRGVSFDITFTFSDVQEKKYAELKELKNSVWVDNNSLSEIDSILNLLSITNDENIDTNMINDLTKYI